MATLKTKIRNALPGSAFALPKQRKLPIHDKSHAVNARSRLEGMRGELSPADYASAKRRIEAAERKFGVKAAKARTSLRAGDRGLRMRIDATTGTVHVVHMMDAEGDVCRVYAPITCLDAGPEGEARPVWIQLAIAGRFDGHPAAKFEFNSDVFNTIIRNFEQVDLSEVAFDFDHASEMPPTEGSVPTEGAPAQGWIRRLENRGTSLWCLVEWLEPARTYIREKKYRFVSPAIRWKAVHPRTGEPIGPRMSSAALTNKPFLRGMHPIVAASDQNMDATILSTYAYSSNEYMPKIRAALRLPELASAAECSDALDRLTDAYDAGSGGVHHGVDVPGYVSGMRDMLDSPLHMTVEQIFEAVRSMIDAAIEEHEATMHPGHEPGDDEMTDTSGIISANGETNMADQDVKKLEREKAVLMNEKATIETEKTTLLARNAVLTLQLNEATTGNDTLLSEVTTLREWKKTREESDVTARVEAAFETYKDKMKLSDTHKTAMRIVLMSDPVTFDAIYPPVRQSERPLLRTIVGPDPKRATDPTTAAGDVKINLSQLARTIAFERKISIAEAQLIVMRGTQH